MKLRYNSDGLIPVILQEKESGQILMFAWANEKAIQNTFETQQAWFYSRSRSELWHKGATSGMTFEVNEVFVDCDEDCLIYVTSTSDKAACHTGKKTCFYRELNTEDQGFKVLNRPEIKKHF